MTHPAALLLLVVATAALSLFTGVGDMSLRELMAADPGATLLLFASRLPRLFAVMLAGASIAIAGLIMQMLARNRFAEPSTAGTVDAASLGMLTVTLLAPDWPVLPKMMVAAAFALAGTLLFLGVLSRVPLRSPLLVPLVGLMLGNVIGALTSFLAYRHDLLQTLAAWSNGDFSTVLRGRYELLWLAFGLAALAYFAADRLTVAGLGRDAATNLGLNYRRVMGFGLTVVAMVTALVVATVGMVPFLGLVVPNIVSLFVGDNMRRTVPLTALLGAVMVLACDIAGRLLLYPFEIPIGTVMGVVGSGLFLFLLLRKRARVG